MYQLGFRAIYYGWGQDASHGSSLILQRFGKRALILGAHTDDEFGCAGTVARMLEEGIEVHYACFSPCEESVPQGWDPGILRREVLVAADVLGLSRDRLYLYEFPVRHFPSHRQEILEELVRIRRRIQPDTVFVPASSDMHQDHAVVAREGLRAFKHATILGYELPMNTISFQHACFVKLDERHVKVKLLHAAAYESQAAKAYMQPDFIRALAVVRGVQIGQPAAEAFEVVRMAIL